MITHSFSQAGQDRFVDRVLEGKRDGVFIDIGANHPTELSNSYAIESELDWRGLLVERDEYCIGLLKKERLSPLLAQDALNIHWPYAIGIALDYAGKPDGVPIDYLSVDCEENTMPIVLRLLATGGPTRFRVMTIETNHYMYGPGPRDAMRLALRRHDYDLLCGDVRASDGSIFEDWWVDPKLVNMENAERFRSDGLRWEQILAKA